jgi:hypothetical protein
VHLILDILQGAGIAAAAGIRPFLPVLAVGALASDDLGVDFGHTDYDFLEAGAFLLAVVVALIVVVLLQRRLGPESAETGPLGAAIAGLGIGLGALEFAGSLADRGHPAWPGLVGGVACAALAQAASRALFARAARRLDPGARQALPVYAEGIALLLALLAVAVPPVSVLALGFLAWLLVGGRRRDGEKYAGLRILR